MRAAKLIGITGKKFCGKDTSVSHLSLLHNVVKYSLAGPLKNDLKNVYKLTDEQLNDPLHKEIIDTRYGKTPRQLMQWYGTDIMRHIDEDYWVRPFMKFYKNTVLKNNSVKIIVTDVRFQNEADAIRSLGGDIVKIVRISNENIDNHISEQHDFLPDIIVYNNGNIQDLQNKLDNILEMK